MSAVPRVLITGGAGYLGRALRTALGNVPGVLWTARQGGDLNADLLDLDDTRRVIEQASPFGVIVHLAAQVPRLLLDRRVDTLAVNTRITSNLVNALGRRSPHVIFASSVAVYGEVDRAVPVDTAAGLRPGTRYGSSKKACEEILLNTALPDIDILRLAPVYEPGHLDDVRKRVYLPGVPLKVRLSPSPLHSLCHVETAVASIVHIIRRGPSGRQLVNVADRQPYSQRTMADWFPGRAIVLPRGCLRPIDWGLRTLPGSFGYALRCAWCKFCETNVYVTCELP